MNTTLQRPQPKGIPADFVLLPRTCPVPGFDLAIGDTVFWRGHEHLGTLGIGSMHYMTADMQPAASVWTEDRQKHVAPLSELQCLIDCEWWGKPLTSSKSNHEP